jgi:hypothetical protein
MSDAEMVPVTDEDVRFAERAMHKLRGYAVSLPNDGHWLTQMAAQYRLAAEAAAIERAANVAEEHADRNGMTRDLCLHIATAIRSLKEGASHVG